MLRSILLILGAVIIAGMFTGCACCKGGWCHVGKEEITM